MKGMGFGLDHSSPCTYKKVPWKGNDSIFGILNCRDNRNSSLEHPSLFCCYRSGRERGKRCLPVHFLLPAIHLSDTGFSCCSYGMEERAEAALTSVLCDPGAPSFFFFLLRWAGSKSPRSSVLLSLILVGIASSQSLYPLGTERTLLASDAQAHPSLSPQKHWRPPR